ncbi:MAG: endonuclease/exonuclease/phosphatase family protein [Gaiellaceae bacterium]
MLIRTWNLFHGNTVPPARVNLLEEAVRLAASGEPDVVCLQEIPVWALEYLDDWSGMIAVGATAARPLLGRELARRVTAINPGLLRSAVTGQANAILVAAGLRVRESHSLALNRRTFRERRVAQTVRLEVPDGRMLTVANLHATNAGEASADAELLRAAVFLDATAAPGDIAVLAGDFNLRRGRALDELAAWGFSRPGPGIDHVLVRGAEAAPADVWPEERRRIGGLLVSDHAPVEVTVS